MKIIDLITDKTLIITNNSNKQNILKILSENNKLYDVKFMSIEEYRNNLLFSYDDRAIYYLYNKYHMKVANAITLLNNLFYIDNKIYLSDKLNYLVKIKQELDNHNLLMYNEYFKEYLKKVNVIIYNYGELDKFTLSLFTNPVLINDKVLNKKIPIYAFNKIENEVEYIFNKIADLLNNNIDINNIKIIKPSEEYIPYLKRFSKFYNIPISFKSDSIYGNKIVQKFLSLIKEGLTNNDILDKLSIYSNTDVYNKIISLINKYVAYPNLLMVYDLLVYDLKQISVNNIYLNTIDFISLDDYIDNDFYVFLLGFNNGYLPNLSKDEDYISDSLKEEVIMSNTNDLNRISNINTLNNLKKINNLVISYKLSTAFNTYFPSNLIEELDSEIISEPSLSYSYSNLYNKLKYSMMLDNYLKYGEYHPDLGILYHNYQDILYGSYDNSYKQINKDSLLKYLDNKLTLSYSSIDNFYKCAFRYYLNNIVQVELFTETFDTIIGNIFHYVLSKAFTFDFNFDKTFDYAISKYNFTNKELFFINKLKKDLIFVIDTIKEYRLNTGLTKELYEERFTVKLKDNPLVTFKGFVDKIMYCEKDHNTYMAIVDYKTGNPDIKLNYLKYGLSMQLASYLYLTKNSGLFDNIKYCGFYLEHILDNEIKINAKKSILESKRDNLKLLGYSTSDQNRLALLDASYENSMMIHGLKVTSKGELSKLSKVLSDEEIENIISLCKDKINEAMENILKADYAINPKVIKGENVGCLYCHFKDICYHKPKDDLYLEEGDNNA